MAKMMLKVKGRKEMDRLYDVLKETLAETSEMYREIDKSSHSIAGYYIVITTIGEK